MKKRKTRKPDRNGTPILSPPTPVEALTAAALRVALTLQPVLLAKADGKEPGQDQLAALAEAERVHQRAAFVFVGHSLMQASAKSQPAR